MSENENRIPKKFRKAHLRAFEGQDFDRDHTLLQWVDLIHNDFNVDDKGLAIFGKLGVGKSTLAAAILNWLVEKEHRERRFIQWFKVTPLLYDLFHFGKSATQEIMGSLRECGLLVLDDIGADKMNEYSDALLLSIVDVRMENQKPTLVTSNLSSAELRARDERLWDRVRMFQTIVLVGESRR